MTPLQDQINENADSCERLLQIIKQLENRIIQLESKKRLVMDDDSWYWDH